MSCRDGELRLQCASPAQVSTLLIPIASPIQNRHALCPLDFNCADDTVVLPSLQSHPPHILWEPSLVSPEHLEVSPL